MTATLTATRTDDQTTTQSSSDSELVNAIRNNRIVQIPWKDLTEDEKRAARVMMFHCVGW